MQNHFSIVKACKKALNIGLDNLKMLALPWLIFSVVQVFFVGIRILNLKLVDPLFVQLITTQSGSTTGAIDYMSNSSIVILVVGGLIGTFIYFLVNIGLVIICLDLYDTGKSEWKRLFAGLDVFLPALATTALYVLIMIGGIMLLIIPSIIWMIKYGFAYFITIDTNPGIMESIRESERLTYGYKWKLLLFFIIINCMTVSFLGYPFACLAMVSVLRQLQGR